MLQFLGIYFYLPRPLATLYRKNFVVSEQGMIIRGGAIPEVPIGGRRFSGDRRAPTSAGLLISPPYPDHPLCKTPVFY